MAYHMHQTAGKFTIRALNIPKALEAAVTAGVPNEAPVLSGTPSQQLVALFKAWRWRLDLDATTGDVVDIQFLGKKYADDDDLFRVIAPYVEAGSFIAMTGEDDESWRWYFDGQELIDQPGIIAYGPGKVVVEVRGGVAEVTECPPGIEVRIIDHDNIEFSHDHRAA